MVSEKDIRTIRLISEYGDLIDALIALRKRKGMSQNELDWASGLQEGYVGKIENFKHKKSGRNLGMVSMPLMLGALGVKLALVRVDPVCSRPKPVNDNQLSLPLEGGAMTEEQFEKPTYDRAMRLSKSYGGKRRPSKKIKKLIFETGRP